MTSLLVFDLDGTLVDSKKDIATSLNFSLAQEGFPTLSESVIQDLVGRGAKRLVQEAIGNPSDEELGRVFLRFWSHYQEHLLDQTELYPGVRQFLESASVPLAVVTNKPVGFSKDILKGLKIDGFFSWVIGGDSFPVQKPDPLVLDPIFEKLGREVRGLMVGDSDVDIQFGKAAGFLTCAVTYGFRSRKELMECQPDFLVDDFFELSQLPVIKLCQPS